MWRAGGGLPARLLRGPRGPAGATGPAGPRGLRGPTGSVQLTETPGLSGLSGGCMNTLDDQSIAGVKSFRNLLAVSREACFQLGPSACSTTLFKYLAPSDPKTATLTGDGYIPIYNGGTGSSNPAVFGDGTFSHFHAVFDVFAYSGTWFGGARLNVFYPQISQDGEDVQRGPRTSVEVLFGPNNFTFSVGGRALDDGTPYGLTAGVNFLLSDAVMCYITSTVTSLPSVG